MQTSKVVNITTFKHHISTYFTKLIADSEPVIVSRSFDYAVLVRKMDYDDMVELLQNFLGEISVREALDIKRKEDSDDFFENSLRKTGV